MPHSLNKSDVNRMNFSALCRHVRLLECNTDFVMLIFNSFLDLPNTITYLSEILLKCFVFELWFQEKSEKNACFYIILIQSHTFPILFLTPNLIY